MSRSRQEYQAIRQREARSKEFYQRDDGVADAPHTICLSVNNNCFMRCRMCDIGTANRDRGGRRGYFSQRYSTGRHYREFPLQRLKELVDETAAGQPIIKTNFVEPLLYKGLEELAVHVKSRGLKFFTVTNGWRLKAHAPWMVELPMDLVRVSLDGTAPVHDSIRGIQGSWERTVSGLEHLVALKKGDRDSLPVLGICYTISNHNQHDLVNFMAALEQRGLLEQVYVNFNHLQYTTAWEVAQTQAESPLFGHLAECSVDHISFDGFDLAALAQQIQSLPQRFDPSRYHYYFSPQLVADDLRDYYDTEKWMFPRSPCYLPWYAAQVEMSGEVGIYGHCVLPSFGNIMEQSFQEVWNSPRAREIRLALKKVGSFPGCNKCIGTLYPLRGRS